jgi:hypothetical protein
VGGVEVVSCSGARAGGDALDTPTYIRTGTGTVQVRISVLVLAVSMKLRLRFLNLGLRNARQHADVSTSLRER